MFKKQYQGVCVGGVADGRTYAHHLPEMTVSPHRKLPDGTFEPIKDQQTEYKFLLLLGDLRDDIGVWVPVGAELEAVIHRLTRYYRPTGLPQRPLH